MQLPRSSGVALPSAWLQAAQAQQHTATPPLTPQPSPGQSRRSSMVAVAAASTPVAAASQSEPNHSASSPSASPHESPALASVRSHAGTASGAGSSTEQQRAAPAPHKAIFIARRAGRQAQQQPQQLQQQQPGDESSAPLDSPAAASAAPAPAALLVAHGDDFASELHTRSPVRHAPDHLLEWPTSRQGAPAAASVQHAYLQHSFSASIDAPFVDATGSSPRAAQPYASSPSPAASSPVRSFIPRRPLPPLQHAPSTPRSSNQQRTPRSAQTASGGPATRMLRSGSSVGAGEDSAQSGGSNVTSPYCRSPCTPFDAACPADPSPGLAPLPHRSPSSPPVTLPSLVVQTQQLGAFPFFPGASSPSSAEGKTAPMARVPAVVLPQLNPSGREAVGTASSARLRKLTDPSSNQRSPSKPGAPRILAALDLPAAVASAQASITAREVQAESRSQHNSPAPAPDSPALRRLPRTPNPGDGALDGPSSSAGSRSKSVSPPGVASTAAAAAAVSASSPKNQRRTRHAHKRTDSKMVYDPRMDQFFVEADSHDGDHEEDMPRSAAAARYSPRRLSGSLNSVAGAADADSAPHSPMHWSDVDADDFFEIQDHERAPATADAADPDADADVDADSEAARSESPSEMLQPCQQIFSPRVPRHDPIVHLAGASLPQLHEFDLQVAEPSAGPKPWERGTRRTNAHGASTSSSASASASIPVAAVVAAAAPNRRLHFHSGELPSPTSFTNEQSDAVGDLLHELPVSHHQQQQRLQQQSPQQQHEFDSSAVEGHSPASDGPGDGDDQEDHDATDRSGTHQRRKRRDTGSMVDLQGMGSFIAQQLRSKPNLRLHLSPAPLLTAGQDANMPASPVAPAPPVLVASALPAHLLQQSGSKVKRIGLRPSMLMNGGSSIGSLDSPSSSSSSTARSSDAISSDAGASSSSCLSTESSVASSRASYTAFGTPSLLARGMMFDASSSVVGVQFGGAAAGGVGFQSPFDSPRPLNLGAGLGSGGGFSKHPAHLSAAGSMVSPGSVDSVHHRRLQHQRTNSTASASSIDEHDTDADHAVARASPQ